MRGTSTPPGAPLELGLAVLRDGAAGGTPMVDLSPEDARARVLAGQRLCADGPDVGVVDLAPAAGVDGAPPVPVRVYEGERRDVTLVYAHGGGWVTGDLDYSDELCRFLAAEAGVRVVSVDYRLAPEHPYPAGLHDLDAAWRWAGAAFAGPLALGGDSAGGNLAAGLVVRRLAVDAEDLPAFLVLVYPVLGLPGGTASYRTRAEAFPIGAADMRWFFAHYLRDTGVRRPTPDLVPLHADSLAGAPPTHVVLAGHDPLHDEGAAFAGRLAQADVPVTASDHPDLCHGFLRFTSASPGARQARTALVGAVARLAESTRASLAPGVIHAYDSPATAGSGPAPGENRGNPR